MPRILSEEDIAEFRARLIAAAERLFAEHGLEAVTMRQLASELGVSPMTPYRYFKDKDDILAAVRADGFDRFSQAQEDAFAMPGTAPEKASEVYRAYLRFAFEHPHAYKLMFDLSQPTEHDYPELVRAGERARATMRRHVDALLDAGLIEGDPAMVAHVFWTALHGAVVLEMAGKLDPGLDAATISREAFRLMIEGLRRKA